MQMELIVVSLYRDFENSVEFNINSGDINPTLTGSNILNTTQTFINAGESLFLNRKFLQEELFPILKPNTLNVTFTENRIKNDV